MAGLGSQPILSGKLIALNLRALIFVGPSGNRIQLNRGAFKATLSRVDSGARPIAGGTIDFRGSHLWIQPSEDVVSTGNGIQGGFEIEAYDRKISGAKITVGTGLVYTATLAPRGAGNVTVRVNLADGAATLWAGDLVGRPTVSAGDATLPSIQLKGAALPASSANVVASSGQIDVDLSKLKGSAEELAIPGPQLGWRMIKPSVAIDRLEGAGAELPDRFAIAHADVTGMTTSNAETALTSSSGTNLFHGTASISFATLSEERRAGKSSWTNVQSDALSTILPAGLSLLNWDEAGLTSALKVDGQFTAAALKLGGIDIAQPFTAAIPQSNLAADLTIPVKFDLPAATGNIKFLNGDQTVAIEGRLGRLALDGRLVIPIPNVELARLEVPQGKFVANVGAAISVSPVIAGAKPNFLDATLDVTNSTDVSVSKARSTGAALINSTIFILSQPVIQIGSNGTRNPATVDFRADGGAVLLYDLGAGKTILAQAKLVVQNVTFGLIGPTPRILDLSGDRFTDPAVTLTSLTVAVDQIGPVKFGIADLNGLSISASHLQRDRAAGTSTGLAYSGDLDHAVTVQSVHAGQVQVDDAIEISGFDVKGLELHIKNASVDMGNGIELSRASLDLAVGDAQEVSVGPTTYRNIQAAQLSTGGRLSVHTAAFSVNDAVDFGVKLSLDGPDNALNGVGSVALGAFTGSARSPLVIKFDCAGSGQLDVDMEANFAVGGAALNAKMTQGKIEAEGSTKPIVALAHSTGPTGCSSPATKHVVQAKGKWWTDGICSKGLHLYHCRWESPEISYSYHYHLNVESLAVTALLTNPHIYLHYDGRIAACNVGVLNIGPVVALGGYSPGIDSPYPGLDNIVNGLIQIYLEPYQSAVLTAVGTGAGWLVSSIATPVGNVLCLGKAL